MQEKYNKLTSKEGSDFLNQQIENQTKALEELNKQASEVSGKYNKIKEKYDSTLETILERPHPKESVGVVQESIGDEQAKDILNEGIALGTTKIGDNFDATNLDNMKDSISLLVECNRLRVANGLPELNTSGLMTAISQVKLNHSCYQEDQTGDINTGLYGTGENLANGYDLTESDEIHEGKGPYAGWYGWQKENLEEFYKEHPEEKGKDIFGILVDYPDLYESVKCYLKILSQEYTVTGSAFIPKQNADSFNNFAQEFAWTSQYVIRDGIESITDEGKMYNTATGQMAVSSFVKKFNSYYNGLSQELLSKKAAYERAKQAVNQSNVDGITLSDAKKAYNTACSKLQELKNKWKLQISRKS